MNPKDLRIASDILGPIVESKGLFGIRLVGVAGFEPATPTSRKYGFSANVMIYSKTTTTRTSTKLTMFDLCSTTQVRLNLKALRTWLKSTRPVVLGDQLIYHASPANRAPKAGVRINGLGYRLQTERMGL